MGVKSLFIFLTLLNTLVTGLYNKRRLPQPEKLPFLSKWDLLSSKLLNTDCVDTVICKSEPFIAKCITCDPRYFYCEKPGASPVEMKCASGKLFNPDPLYAKCILKDNCPYHPPWTVPTTAKPPITKTPEVVTSDSKCLDTITCGSEHFVAKCVNCDPRYFYCENPGALPLEKKCASGKVFNPDPLFANCILIDNCPYHPPWTLPSTKATPKTTTTTTTPTTTTTTTTPKTTTTTTTTTTTISTTTTPKKPPSTPSISTTGATTPSGTNEPSTTIPFTSTPVTTASRISSNPTTTLSSIFTSSVPTATPECWDSLTCSAKGDFPKCIYCYKEYFHCEAKGEKGVIRKCDGITVFNTDPEYPKCISITICPYHPPPTDPPVPTPPTTPSKATTFTTTVTTTDSTSTTPTSSTTPDVISSTPITSTAPVTISTGSTEITTTHAPTTSTMKSSTAPSTSSKTTSVTTTTTQAPTTSIMKSSTAPSTSSITTSVTPTTTHAPTTSTTSTTKSSTAPSTSSITTSITTPSITSEPITTTAVPTASTTKTPEPTHTTTPVTSHVTTTTRSTTSTLTTRTTGKVTSSIAPIITSSTLITNTSPSTLGPITTAATTTMSPTKPLESTTIASSTLTSNVPTTSSDCRDPFHCPGKGNFTKCNYCYKEYYYCEGEGEWGILKPCGINKLFNPVESYPCCVSFTTCPSDPESLYSNQNDYNGICHY